MFLTPQVLQIAGAVLVAAALAQVAVLFVSSFRRVAFEGERRRESLEGTSKNSPFSGVVDLESG